MQKNSSHKVTKILMLILDNLILTSQFDFNPAHGLPIFTSEEFILTKDIGW